MLLKLIQHLSTNLKKTKKERKKPVNSKKSVNFTPNYTPNCKMFRVCSHRTTLTCYKHFKKPKMLTTC